MNYSCALFTIQDLTPFTYFAPAPLSINDQCLIPSL